MIASNRSNDSPCPNVGSCVLFSVTLQNFLHAHCGRNTCLAHLTCSSSIPTCSVMEVEGREGPWQSHCSMYRRGALSSADMLAMFGDAKRSVAPAMHA